MSAPSERIGVHLDRPGGPVRVGTAFVTTNRQHVSTRFAYDESYLERTDAIALGPDLPLGDGPGIVDGLPGALNDSAPDRWGRRLVTIVMEARARAQGLTPPTVRETHHLLAAGDTTRQGALRYTVDGDDQYVSTTRDVPPLTDLPELVRAAASVSSREADGEAAAATLLIDIGAASLGGARPKVPVHDEGRPLIAKLPHGHDEWDVARWEKTALDLAAACGITTPARQLVEVDGATALLVERFDRRGTERVPYLSAMTMVGGRPGEDHDYLELVEAMAAHASSGIDDLHQLWRRIAFSIAINNTDDHLRNHGFLHDGRGWRLSPVFDVNPNPVAGTERATGINFTNDPAAARTELIGIAPYFDLGHHEAAEVMAEVDDVVAGWRTVAVANGVDRSELRRFAGALPR